MGAFLEVEFRKSSESAGRLSYGLVVSVKSSSSIPPEVFVFHRSAPQLASGLPWDGKVVETFQNVATPVDMHEVPAAGVAPVKSPYARRDSVKLVFRCVDDMNRAAEDISSDIADLVDSWDNVGDDAGYGEVETRTYGCSPEAQT